MHLASMHFQKGAIVRFVLWLLFAVGVTGCLPVTTAKIQLGAGYNAAEMDRAEAIVERLGFSRIMFEPRGEKALPRAKYPDEWVSNFELNKAFGVSVSFSMKDGSLTVGFAERNTRFSAEGEELLRTLTAEMRSTYGDKVSISDGGPGAH